MKLLAATLCALCLLVLTSPSSSSTTGLATSEAPWVYTWRIRGSDGAVLRQFKTQYPTPSSEQWVWQQDHIHYNGHTLVTDGNGAGWQFETLAHHVDHLGTPRVITGLNGEEYARHKYLPYGTELTEWDDRMPLKFTGHERDLDDLDYMRARYYRPSYARFLSPDPARDSWNLYAYADGNPVGRADPTGLSSDEPVILMEMEEVKTSRDRSGNPRDASKAIKGGQADFDMRAMDSPVTVVSRNELRGRQVQLSSHRVFDGNAYGYGVASENALAQTEFSKQKGWIGQLQVVDANGKKRIWDFVRPVGQLVEEVGEVALKKTKGLVPVLPALIALSNGDLRGAAIEVASDLAKPIEIGVFIGDISSAVVKSEFVIDKLAGL